MNPFGFALGKAIVQKDQPNQTGYAVWFAVVAVATPCEQE